MSTAKADILARINQAHVPPAPAIPRAYNQAGSLPRDGAIELFCERVAEYQATVHRVVSPPPGVERISLAYFFNPKLEATLTPIDLPPHLAALAPGGDSDDPDNPILANYGDNSLKVRLRAHPDVAAVHHADLLALGTWAPR